MALLTRKNGGEASLQEVADAWKRGDRNIDWSTYESNAWAVEFAKKLQREEKKALLKEAPAARPMNIP